MVRGDVVVHSKLCWLKRRRRRCRGRWQRGSAGLPERAFGGPLEGDDLPVASSQLVGLPSGSQVTPDVSCQPRAPAQLHVGLEKAATTRERRVFRVEQHLTSQSSSIMANCTSRLWLIGEH